MREKGADYSKARLPLRPYVVVDRNLYTGQNPLSSELLAQRIVSDVDNAGRTPPQSPRSQWSGQSVAQ